MAKVKGPLMSLAASGVWDNSIEFKTGNGKTIAAGVRKSNPARSTAQLVQAEKFRNAVVAWRGLDGSAKQVWKSASNLTGLTGYQFFIAEFSAQNITPPDLPVVP